MLPDCHGFCSCPIVSQSDAANIFILTFSYSISYDTCRGHAAFTLLLFSVEFFLGCLVPLRLFARAAFRKVAGVSWSRKTVCADQDRRLKGSEFLPTHCSHNGDRKRDLYDQCSLNGFSCKRNFWPVRFVPPQGRKKIFGDRILRVCGLCPYPRLLCFALWGQFRNHVEAAIILLAIRSFDNIILGDYIPAKA